jgi:hypothetical protein
MLSADTIRAERSVQSGWESRVHVTDGHFYRSWETIFSFTAQYVTLLQTTKFFPKYGNSTDSETLRSGFLISQIPPHLDRYRHTLTDTATPWQILPHLDRYRHTLTDTATPWQILPHLDRHRDTLTDTATPWQIPPHLDRYRYTLTDTATPWQIPPHLDRYRHTLTDTATPWQILPHLDRYCHTLTDTATPWQILPHLDRYRTQEAGWRTCFWLCPYWAWVNRNSQGFINFQRAPVLTTTSFLHYYTPKYEVLQIIQEKENIKPLLLAGDNTSCYTVLKNRKLTMSWTFVLFLR